MRTNIYRSAIVPFSTSQMFDLVNDIEQYPQFLPWCPKAQILSRTLDEIEATVHFSQGGFQKSFTTVNRLLPHERVEMRLREGPFRYLEGQWQFETMGQGTQISLNLSFEFSHALLSMMIGPLFQKMAGNLVEAFTQRAHRVYA